MNRTTIERSEIALAADEFAAWIRKNRAKIQQREHYEVRPCKRVRGFMLRLPGIGWKLWFSTAANAVNFTGLVTSIHAANCAVYDSAGQRVGLR